MMETVFVLAQDAAPPTTRAPDTGNWLGGSYDMPGGAHGSLTTAEFSLAGYQAGDKPVLYFNYYADTDPNQNYDGFRVYVSSDGADWDLLGTTTDITAMTWRACHR